MGRGAEVTQQRINNSGFDFRHSGAGSAPRDPRPLRWPDEPGFAAAVSSVLDNAATEVVINIRSNRTHATDGALAGELKGSASTSEAARSARPRPACTSARASRRPVGGGGRTAVSREPAAVSVSMICAGWHDPTRGMCGR
jgi:hypothetical protein